MVRLARALPLAALVVFALAATTLPAEPGPNLVTNPSFAEAVGKTGFKDWGLSVRAGAPKYRVVQEDGGSCLYAEFEPRDMLYLDRGLPLAEHGQYRLTYRCKLKTAGARAPSLMCRVSRQSDQFWRTWADASPDVVDEWQTLTLDFVVPSGKGGVGLRFMMNTSQNAGQVWLKDISVVEVPLTEYQKANLIRTPKGQVFYPALTQAPARQEPPDQARKDGLFWWSIGDGAMQSDMFAASAVSVPVRLRMARDGSACSVVVVEAAHSLKDVAVAVPDAVNGVATLTVQRARVMPQLMGYRSSLFEFIPEILDPLPKTFSLAAGERAQFFIRAQALPTAHAQGCAAMTLTLGDGRKTAIPIEVSVAPFALAPCPADFTWGLYPDPGRWEKYTDAQLDAELRWLRQCGMTTLLLYPPYQSISEFGKLDDSKADAAVAAWKKSLEAWGNRYLRAFERAGFGPRYVCNIQSLSKHLSRATGINIIEEHQYDEALLPWVKRYVEALEETRRANKWPFFYYHLVDEPGGALDPRASAEFDMLKQLGLPQYTTANHENVVRDFRDKLDVFCCASGVFRVQASVERIRGWLKDYPNAQVWQYGGAGAYTGQEGRIGPNRFGAGFLSWKLGVNGLFLWTFQRIGGESANDFDDAGKDAAMTYPAAGGGSTLSTLQWEGVCQGIEDYRYLRLLESLIAQRAKDPGPAAARAKEAAAWLAQFKQSLWTFAQPQPPSNALMDQWRGEMIERIAGLVK